MAHRRRQNIFQSAKRLAYHREIAIGYNKIAISYQRNSDR